MPREFAHDSERLFAKYLDDNGLTYDREVFVDPGNVDFRVTSESGAVLCDVKAAEEPPREPGRVDVYIQIREDIRKLRQKFGERRPLEPCVLVTMNFSRQMFTGFSVRRAMLGEVEAVFENRGGQWSQSPFRHAQKGNAQLTSTKNTGISGVLVIDCFAGDHHFFVNPYAEKPAPEPFFPSTKTVFIQKSDGEEEMLGDSDATFFPCR